MFSLLRLLRKKKKRNLREEVFSTYKEEIEIALKVAIKEGNFSTKENGFMHVQALVVLNTLEETLISTSLKFHGVKYHIVQNEIISGECLTKTEVTPEPGEFIEVNLNGRSIADCVQPKFKEVPRKFITVIFIEDNDDVFEAKRDKLFQLEKRSMFKDRFRFNESLWYNNRKYLVQMDDKGNIKILT